MRGPVSRTEGERDSVFASLLAGLLLPCLVTSSPLGSHRAVAAHTRIMGSPLGSGLFAPACCPVPSRVKVHCLAFSLAVLFTSTSSEIFGGD